MAVKITCARKYATDTHGYLGIQQFANGKTKKGLGIKVEWEHWKKFFNHEFNQFSKNSPFAFEEINKTIRIELAKFDDGIFEIPQPVFVPTPIATSIEEDNAQASVLAYMLVQMELKKTEGTKGNYLDVHRKLKKFLLYNGRGDFRFEEFTPEFMVRFKNYCLTIKDPQLMTDGGFKNYVRVLKSIYNTANDSGYFYFRRNPFALIKNEKYAKREKHPLEVHQVKALMDMDGLTYMYKICRSMFYFQLLANGMRCSDVMFLKYKDFKNGRLFYKMMKTNSDSSIPITFKMMKIFSELLGEENKYDELIQTRQISDLIKTDGVPMNLAELEREIVRLCPQSAFVEGSGKTSYGGFTVKENDFFAKNLIDARHALQMNIDSEFIDYMQDVIDKQNPEAFVFLSVFAPKQVKFFQHYNKGEILSEGQYLKYKAIRNKYNVYLRELSKKYNDKIPNVKNRWELLIHLSSHVARNTFVNVLLQADVDIYKISHGLVHSELQTTQNYIRKGFDQNMAGSANKTLNDIL